MKLLPDHPEELAGGTGTGPVLNLSCAVQAVDGEIVQSANISDRVFARAR